MFATEKSLCQAPGCLTVFEQKPGGRRREFCKDACRKASSRLGRRELPAEKIESLSSQMRDVMAQLTQLHTDFCELDNNLTLIVEWWGSSVSATNKAIADDWQMSTFQTAISNQEGSQ